MSAEARFRVWCVVVRIPSRSQDHVDLDTGLKALFPKSKTLQFLQAVLLSSAIHDGIPEDLAFHTRKVHCRFARSATTIFLCVLGVFEFPRVLALVVTQARIVVTLVEKFEDTGQCLGFSKS